MIKVPIFFYDVFVTVCRWMFLVPSPVSILINPLLSRCVYLRGRVKDTYGSHKYRICVLVPPQLLTASLRLVRPGLYTGCLSAAWYKWIPGRSSQLLSHNHTVHTQNGELLEQYDTTPKPSCGRLALFLPVPDQLSQPIITRKQSPKHKNHKITYS